MSKRLWVLAGLLAPVCYTAALVLAAVGLAGLLMFYFTQDPIGAPLTIRGIGHFVLAGVEALGTIAACLLCGLGFGRIPALAQLRTYSIVSSAIIFIVGGANTATISFSPVFGIGERVTIFTFMIWAFVVALRLTPRSTEGLAWASK